MTHQEMFDKSWLGLKAQGFKLSRTKKNGIDQCAYRGRGARRCAIGHCIPDEAYSRNLEGNHADTPAILAILGHEHKGFALALQGCHDDAKDPRDMEDRLRDFASARGIPIPEPI